MITVIGAMALPTAVHADTTVVAQVAVTEVIQPSLDQVMPLGTTPPQRQERAHSSQTVTTYYKNGNARTEAADGTVILYDGVSGKVYTINPAQKTYYYRTVKDTEEPPQVSASGAGAQSKVDSSIDIKQGSEVRTILGATAKVYVVSGVVTITPQRRGFGGGGGGRSGGRGHRRGGGGFPGGGGGGFPGGGGGFPLLMQRGDDTGGGDPNSGDPYSGSPNGGGRTRSMEVSGEFWLSDSVKLPSDKKATILPTLQSSLTGGDLALKPLTDNLNKKKDIPLDSRLTFTHTVARTGAQDSMTTAVHVTSISLAPLSDALFQLPLGLTQVAPPFVTLDDGSDDSDTGAAH